MTREQETRSRLFFRKIKPACGLALRLIVMLVLYCFPLLFEGHAAYGQSLSSDPRVQSNFAGITEIGSSIGSITQMTFGPDGKLYVATYSDGIKRFDYDPSGTLSNEVTVWSRPDNEAIGEKNGSLGIAFHTDPMLGDVMYIAPAVPFTFAPEPIEHLQSIVRLTDSNADGTWGGAGEVNQEIVADLRVTDLHQVNQMQVRDDSLYVGIGSRVRTGGEVSELPGAPNANDGEFSYSGSVNWIRDLSQLSSDSTTTNLAGFNITNPETDSQPFTSSDTGKLTVFSSGFRNVYGIAFDGEGQLWATMNQNENPLAPDELHKTDFQDDHQFPKKNEISGDWKLNADAINAGFFQTFESPVATLGNHASANGLDFTYANSEFAGEAFLVRFSSGKDLLSVDPDTGAITTVATDFSSPIDVLTDPSGNLLVGQYADGGIIDRLVLFSEPLPILGDLNDDDLVNQVDWGIFRGRFNADFSGLTQEEAFAMGDFNNDFLVDEFDYKLFKNAFEEANGTGSFDTLLQAPEPSTIVFLGLGCLALLLNRRRDQRAL